MQLGVMRDELAAFEVHRKEALELARRTEGAERECWTRQARRWEAWGVEFERRVGECERGVREGREREGVGVLES